ncbi:MAG TPA: hypothetical protein VK327_11745 [Candidatus Paceibacterota bacterium]|nr:hypothetical protein [Candidatus Paceibacterota bacterium]
MLLPNVSVNMTVARAGVGIAESAEARTNRGIFFIGKDWVFFWLWNDRPEFRDELHSVIAELLHLKLKKVQSGLPGIRPISILK